MIDLMREFNRLREDKYLFTKTGIVVSPPRGMVFFGKSVPVRLVDGTVIAANSPDNEFLTAGAHVLVVSASDGYNISYAIFPMTPLTVIDNTNFLAVQPTQSVHDNTPTRKTTYKCSWCGATNDANKHALECRQCSGPRNSAKEKFNA